MRKAAGIAPDHLPLDLAADRSLTPTEPKPLGAVVASAVRDPTGLRDVGETKTFET
jgi:hypothetical protein